MLEFQVNYYIAILLEKIKLPTQTDMMDEFQRDKGYWETEEGHLPRHYHRFRDRQWPYMEELANISGSKYLPKYFMDIFNTSVHRLVFELSDYKNYNYKVHNDDTFTDSFQ